MNIIAKKFLRAHRQTIFLLSIMILTGCSSSVPEGQITATANPTEHSSPTVPTSFVTVVPLTEETTVLPPETILQFQPFEITSDLPVAAKPMDALVLCGDLTVQLVRFTPKLNTETIQKITGDLFCLETSPDGKWIVYEQDSQASPTGSWLVVQSIDGQQKKVPENSEWVNFGDYVWLDNQRLIFNNFINPPDVQRLLHDPAYPMVVINPFTGEQSELSSDYPGLTVGDGSAGEMGLGYSDVAYDPSLNLVIFPARDEEYNYYIVLWDWHSQTVLAKVESQSRGFGRYPVWSPDATQFAVAVTNAIKDQRGIDEWYRVSREGQVEQLTHFGDYFSSSEIGAAYNWSPDGRKLAFWIDLSPSPCPGLRLAILDVTTKEVTNTCLPGTRKYALPPLWSLDSRYLIIEDYSNPPIKTILVDTENGRAFDITSHVGDSRPIGWLASP